jgi:cob(I)alamin adenosyltransferase
MEVDPKAGDGQKALLMFQANTDSRIRLLGSINVLTSQIGLIKAETNDEVLKKSLEHIQNKLMQFIAHLSDKKNLMYFFERSDIEGLEKSTNYYKLSIAGQKGFTLQKKTQLSTDLEFAVAIAKTVEDCLLQDNTTYAIEPNAKEYINKLPEYLMSVASYVEFVESVEKAVIKVLREQLPQQSTSTMLDITLKTAKALIAEVEKKAIQMGLHAVIAVASASAHPVAIQCMDDSYIASFDIAMNKAYTSVALKMSTIELKAMSQPNGSLYGIEHTNNGKIVIFGGGVPLVVDGKIVGGLGVSGGTEQQDTELAQYGQNLFKEVITWQ